MSLPTELRQHEESARAVLRTGWRPAIAEGPTRTVLAEIIGQAAVAG
jgi:hypothetical protein